MASKPYYDAKKKRWFMKWWTGVERGWFKQTLGPHPAGEPLKKTAPKSIQLVARRYEDMETQARHGVNVAPARAHDLKTYLGNYEEVFNASHAENSGTNLKAATKSFLPFCEGRGVKTVEAVTPRICRDWLESLVNTRKHSTIRMYRGYLSPAWSRAVMDEIILKNPWERLPIPGRPKDKEPIYWTREELDKLILATEGWLRDVLIVGVNTGLRISALLNLEWRDVSFERSQITVRQESSKSGRKYYVPINNSANQVLAERINRRGTKDELVFPGPRSNAVVNRKDTYAMFKAAAVRAGIPDKGHHNHILRHTFASHAAMKGIPLAVISGWLGHTSLRMVEVYSHLIPAESNSRMAQFDLAPPPIDRTS